MSHIDAFLRTQKTVVEISKICNSVRNALVRADAPTKDIILCGDEGWDRRSVDIFNFQMTFGDPDLRLGCASEFARFFAEAVSKNIETLMKDTEIIAKEKLEAKRKLAEKEAELILPIIQNK